MKKKNETKKDDSVLTEEMLSKNIAKSNEDYITENEEVLDKAIAKGKEELNSSEQTQKKNKKKPFIIGTTVLAVILVGLLGFLLLGSHVNEEELATNFSITSIKPKTDGNFISNNETFIVKTSVANEDIVRQHLYVEPAVNYDIKEINSKEYEVSLKNIPSDTLVNLSLVKNEVKSYSWAFQSTKDLKVLSVYPANGATAVSTDTGINILLSYMNVTDLQNYFEISPHVEGTFSNSGKTWRFVPKEPLKDNTTYTITIKKGLKAGENVLEESVTTTFSTYNRPQNNSTENGQERLYKHAAISVDKINNFTPSEQVTFKMYLYEKYEIGKIKMYKFNSYNDFIKFLNNENDYKTTDLGEQAFTKVDKYNSYILTNKFGEGYYAEEVYLSNGELYATIPVQVNKLSTFMFASDDDLLLWVGSGNTLLKDINVTYNGKTYKTDSEGTVLIKKYNDESGKMKYLQVGDKNNPLIIGINSFEKFDYPEAYIYTDKPLYKNTDEINIWGYIPEKFYKDYFDDYSRGNFVLSVNEENIPLSLSDDGTFIAKYKLDNHVDSYVTVTLKYKERSVAYRWVEVRNYSKQNYEYDVRMDRNYVKAGEKFNFTVHVDHVSGINVQNKTITATFDDKVYTATTDSSGDAKFSIPTKTTSDYSGISWQYVTLNTGDSEYNENQMGFPFYTINHDIVFDFYSSNYDSKTQTSEVRLVIIDPKKNVENLSMSNYFELLKVGDYTGKIKVELEEEHYVKKFSHSYYNEFTEKTEDIYTYEPAGNNIVETNTVDVVNGKAKYKINYNFKKSTENDRYYYTLTYTVNYKNDVVKESEYVYSYSDYEYSQYGQYIYSDFWDGIYGSDDYDYYRYYITKSNHNNNKYSVGDYINYSLNSYNGASIEKDAKVMKITFKNNIIDKKIMSTEVLDYADQFSEASIPGIGISGALFNNGRFYRFPSYYYDYNEEDSKVNIEIKQSKEKYSPGETVKLTIKTTDPNGKGIKSKLNISVVDKAVFNVVPDSTNLVESIYENMYYRAYTYSTNRDYDLGIAQGGRGDTGDSGTRTKFSDTVYFKELETNENGDLEVEFKLNDSVTSFVTTVHAVNKDAYVGVNKKEIISTLPLAISVIEPNGLKEADDAVISANSIGDVKGDINYVFELVGTDKKIEKKAKVGVAVYANFGHLEEGEYNVKVTATNGDAKDAINFPFVVKKTQQEISVKAISTIGELKDIKPTKNPIILEFYKEGFTTYMKYLDILVGTNQDRLDTKVAYYMGLGFENKYYGYEYPITVSDMEKFNNNGVLKYLENAENSYIATALVNYVYPSLYELDKDTLYTELYETSNSIIALDRLLVLASMKEPVLDELASLKSIINSDDDFKAKLALAYVLIGDYDSAKELYKGIKNAPNSEGVMAIVATFVDKDNASKMIDTLYEKDNADKYVYFAMLSFFLNNEADLSRESTIKVSYGDKNTEVKLKGLMMKKLVINNKDLETLKITSDDNSDKINYYYEGGISEIDENNIKKDLSISLFDSNATIGQTVYLNIDLSKFSGAGNLKVYLPNAFRLAGEVKSDKGVYLSANRGEYLVLYVTEDHSNKASIPLYVTYPGSYKFEEIILKQDETYHISNSINVNIK